VMFTMFVKSQNTENKYNLKNSAPLGDFVLDHKCDVDNVR